MGSRSSVTQDWSTPASICHSQNEDFSGNMKTLFLFLHQFSLNVLCSRCVLFSTLHCWAYVFLLVSYFIFHETPLDKIWTWFDLHGEIPEELSSCLINLAVFEIAAQAEFIFEAYRVKEKVGDKMGKGKIITFKLCPDALWCILNQGILRMPFGGNYIWAGNLRE